MNTGISEVYELMSLFVKGRRRRRGGKEEKEGKKGGEKRGEEEEEKTVLCHEVPTVIFFNNS